jgi:SWI/SNF-related matrix-associated actin-dependent regulator 1 of chromatin subfamily A
VSLKPYQVEGAHWLSHKKCALLADPPGLGKSAQAITALDDLFADRILLICPAIARYNWVNEFEKWGQLPRKCWVGLKGRDKPDASAHVHIMSFEGASSYYMSGALRPFRYDAAVIDEAHFLKSPRAKRTQTILGAKGLWRKAARIWTMTGTPMPNHPGELWTQLYAFGATTLPYKDFIETFCEFAGGETVYQEGFTQIVGAKRKALPDLRALLAKVMLRRNIKIDVPLLWDDFIVEPGRIDFPADKLAEAESQMAELGLKLSALDDKAIARWMEANAQSVSTLRRYTGLRKVDPVVDLVSSELEAGQYKKIVIFVIHKEVGRLLWQGLNRFQPLLLTGETSPSARELIIKSFQTNPLAKVLIANITAAGTAINLTASSQVLFAETDWVPANNEQAAKRCHRIGQEFPVTARIIALRNSIDQKIASVLRRKMNDISELLEK